MSVEPGHGAYLFRCDGNGIARCLMWECVAADDESEAVEVLRARSWTVEGTHHRCDGHPEALCLNCAGAGCRVCPTDLRRCRYCCAIKPKGDLHTWHDDYEWQCDAAGSCRTSDPSVCPSCQECELCGASRLYELQQARALSERRLAALVALADRYDETLPRDLLEPTPTVTSE